MLYYDMDNAFRIFSQKDHHMENNEFAKIAGHMLAIVGRILVFIFLLLWAVPVILLPVSTVVPALFSTR